MNQDQPELTLDESVKQVMQTLPPVIRDYLSQGKYSEVANHLMIKYGLRVDQGGILEREIMLILMGIEDQNEFASSLKNEAVVSDDVVRNIMTDINQEIFIPLREQMMKIGAGNIPQPPKPIVPPVQPRIPIPPERNNIIPANPQFPRPQQQTYVSTPKYAPPSRLAEAVSESGPPPAPKNDLAAALKQVLHEGGQTSLPAKSVNVGRLLEDHEEPHIDVRDKVQVVSKPTIEPLVSVPLKPSTLPASPELKRGEPLTLASGVIPPGVRFSPRLAAAPSEGGPPIVPKVESPVPPIQPKPVLPPVSSKPYSTDPYREPIDTP